MDRIRTIDQLKDHCFSYIAAAKDLLKAANAAAEMGDPGSNLSYWAGWNGVELIVYCAKSAPAEMVLSIIDSFKTKSEAEILRIVVDHARLGVESRRYVNLASRSTSLSANLLEDAQNQFWIEIMTLVVLDPVG